MSDDWTQDMFPGDGLEIPSDDERDRADALIAEWAQRWQEAPRTVARRHSDTNAPTNRAFLRAQLKRWWAQK